MRAVACPTAGTAMNGLYQRRPPASSVTRSPEMPFMLIFAQAVIGSAPVFNM
jgi:hypothetical protein